VSSLSSESFFTFSEKTHMCSQNPQCHFVIKYGMSWHRSTKWQRPIGCLKLKVIFRTRATNYRALLRKMTCEDKAFVGSSPPCITQKQKEFGIPNVMTSHTCSQNDIAVFCNVIVRDPYVFTKWHRGIPQKEKKFGMILRRKKENPKP